MRYHAIHKFDTANGPGIRTTLFVSGCRHRCKGCHNPQTWDIHSGYKFTHEIRKEIIDSLDHDYIDGITLSGGDPLYDSNIEDVYKLLATIKVVYPNKSIWLYTGYDYEDILKERDSDAVISRYDILKYCDVLVDGRFELDKRDISLPYCGSSNQRVIDVKASLASRKVILYEQES